MTYVPSLSETSESLKINKEVLRNLRVGESIRCFPIPLFVLIGLVWGGGGKGVLFVLFFVFQAQIADIHTKKRTSWILSSFSGLLISEQLLLWSSHKRNYW